ncbi:hypothetical protein SK128_027436 [Halocaridina rubra]|uniref:Protein broad-minded n=1 Tax=Halocaridina rubra TaxID=373956 RepID=A0AAN8X5D9_HALRR
MAASKSTSEDCMSVKSQIKDLLAHMDPMIYLAGTADNSSEMLACLADMDPSFHKLELVRSLRKEMRDKLDQAIETHAVDYLEQHKGKMRADNPVDMLVEHIRTEDSFMNFVAGMQGSIRDTVQEIIDCFDDEIVTGMFSSEEDEATLNASPNDSNESSLNSSLNQSGLLFLHPAQYNNIAKSLSSKRESSTWTDSLNILVSVTPGEPVMQDCWPSLRKGLKECLLDESPGIVDRALKVHCKLLTSQVHNAVKEAYLNLLEAVAGFYMSKRLISKIPLKGEPMDVTKCENLVRILKVLTEFQQELPLLWVRYPERYIDDMIEATFNLLSINLGKRDNKIMSPLDLLALVDHQALWFKRWVHGQWGRSKVFLTMRSNSLVLMTAASFCIQYLEKCPGTIEGVSASVLSFSTVQYLRFVQYLNIVMTSICFSGGRKLFPINIQTKEELVTIQGLFQIFLRAFNDKSLKAVAMEISRQLQKFCCRDEVKCWIICDAGVVETLLLEVGQLDPNTERENKKLAKKCIPPMFLQSILQIFSSILSTQVGQNYVLLGRKRKASSKSNLTSVATKASEVLDLIYLVLENEDAGMEVRNEAIKICSLLLSSPLGIHICIQHPLVEKLIDLICREDAILSENIPFDDQLEAFEPLHINVQQSLPLLVAFLTTYRGIYILENKGRLTQLLEKVLPHLAKNGQLNTRILTCVCSSPLGSSVVGEYKLVCPYWDILCHLASVEEPGQQPPKEDDKEEVLMTAMAPLRALAASYHGSKLLFSDGGLLESLSDSLFSSDNLLEEVHFMALHILGSSMSVLDSVIYLETTLGYQEKLLAQQYAMSLDEGTSVIVDEKSVLRNHILVKSYLLGGTGERILPPAFIESPSTLLPHLFSSYPPPREYIPEKPLRSQHKKQNEVWRFLNDTRCGLHDSAWLNYCRKSVRSALVSGEDLKTWLVMDIMERALRVLVTSTDDLLIGSPLTNVSKKPTHSSAFSDSFMSTSEPRPPLRYIGSTPTESGNSESHLAAVELIIRYGSELQLLPSAGNFKENLLEILSFTQSRILCSYPERCDWFTMVVFLICGGSVEKCCSILSNLSGVLTGGVLWSCFSDSLSMTHELLPGEITMSGIIHNAQLVLSIENPTLFYAVQANEWWLWNMIGDWVRCIFLGVLPWQEVCNYVVIVLLHGPDFAVYFVVAFLRHMQNIILKYAGSPRCLTIIQTSTVTDWHAGEHLNFMEVLSRRHRRTILPSLTSFFYNLRHHYTSRQS